MNSTKTIVVMGTIASPVELSRAPNGQAKVSLTLAIDGMPHPAFVIVNYVGKKALMLSTQARIGDSLTIHGEVLTSEVATILKSRAFLDLE